MERGSSRRTWLVLALLVLGLGALATAGSAIADSPASSSSKADSSGLSTDLRMGYIDSIDFQGNIFASYNSTPYFIFAEVYDLLVNSKISDGSADFAHSPAYKRTVSKDGLTITYWLRKGLRWSDGKPMNAKDVVWSYRHASMSNVNSDYTANMKSITREGLNKVVIKMRRYDARILTAYVPIVPEHIWAPHAKNPGTLTHFNPCCPMVGSGPFYVKSINTNGTSVMEPNPYFYGPKGHVKRILLIKYDDEDAMKRDLELGQLDALNDGQTTWATEFRKEQDVKLWSSPGPGFDELAFNMCPPQGSPGCTGPAPGVHVAVVQDKAIRTAISWAINRQIIDTVVYAGQAPPGNGLISPWYEARGYYKSYANTPGINYTYDPQKAHQVLEQGGWKCPPVDANGVCTKNGQKAEFTMVLRSDDPAQERVGLRIQAWAKAVGIKIDTKIETDDALNAQIYKSTSSKNPADADKYEPSYDAFMWDWGGDTATPDYVFEVLQCGNSSADSMWCNHQFTKLSQQALRTKDFKKRVALLHQAEEIELRELPYVITDYSPYLETTRTDTWTNWQPSPTVGGQPFGYSWMQLQLIQPGKKASSNYAGATWVIIFFIGVAAVVWAIGYYRRRREERQPFELPPSGSEAHPAT